MRWGDWSLNSKLTQLVRMLATGYNVHLADIHSSAAMLDWIFQIQGKPWSRCQGRCTDLGYALSRTCCLRRRTTLPGASKTFARKMVASSPASIKASVSSDQLRCIGISDRGLTSFCGGAGPHANTVSRLQRQTPRAGD